MEGGLTPCQCCKVQMVRVQRWSNNAAMSDEGATLPTIPHFAQRRGTPAVLHPLHCTLPAEWGQAANPERGQATFQASASESVSSSQVRLRKRCENKEGISSKCPFTLSPALLRTPGRIL